MLEEEPSGFPVIQNEGYRECVSARHRIFNGVCEDKRGVGRGQKGVECRKIKECHWLPSDHVKNCPAQLFQIFIIPSEAALTECSEELS